MARSRRDVIGGRWHIFSVKGGHALTDGHVKKQSGRPELTHATASENSADFLACKCVSLLLIKV